MNSSDEANFPLYISWSERVTTKRRREYNIEFPDSAIGFKALKQKQVPLELNGLNSSSFTFIIIIIIKIHCLLVSASYLNKATKDQFEKLRITS